MSTPSKIFGIGTDYDISERTVFRGDSTSLVLQPGTTWPTDELGVTTMVRRWKCRRDLAEGFKPRRGDLDFLHRELKVIDCDAIDEGAITTLTVRYNGFLDRQRAPTVIQRRNNQRIETTLVRTGAIEGSLTLVYLAPTYTRVWAQEREPEFEDLYEDKAKFRRVPIQPLFFRLENGTQLEGDINALLRTFDFEVRTVRTQFDPQPDGHVFRVTEVLQRQIVQPQVFVSRGWLTQLLR